MRLTRILNTNIISYVYRTHNVNFANKTEKIVRADKSIYKYIHYGLKDIRQIGIIGWGSQAKAQACNIRDTLNYINSKIKIKVGLRENSKSLVDVKNNNFETGTITNVVRESQLNLILISDYAQTQLYKDIFSVSNPNTTLGFSHGFLKGYLKNKGEDFPKKLNVVMMAPKGMGPTLRTSYMNGDGINCSIAVDKNKCGVAMEHALSWAVAVGSPTIYGTTFENEYKSDLVGERGILLGGIYGIIEYLFRYLDYNRENIRKQDYLTVYDILTNKIPEKIKADGLCSLYDHLSPSFKKIFETNYIKSYYVSKQLLYEIYDEVESGNEINSVIINSERELMPLNTCRLKEIEDILKKYTIIEEFNYLYPMTAGLYMGSLMAQVDVLTEKGHNYSEIVNESIIEATDSLLPYMREHGLGNMIDNCSTTARLGARKWGPRLESLLNKCDNIPDNTYLEDLKNNKIHSIYDDIKKIN